MNQVLVLRRTDKRRQPIAASYRTGTLAALLIGLSIPAASADDPYRACAPAIAVRTANPPGEADVVASGPDGSLTYYFATPGSPWQSTQIPGSGHWVRTLSPAIAVHPDGEVDVIAAAAGGLTRYWATPGSQWQSQLIESGSFSSPAIALAANGDAHVAAWKTDDHSLMYYSLPPRGAVASIAERIGDPGLAHSAPAIAVRSSGEVDIAVQASNNTLMYLWHLVTDATWWTQVIPGAIAESAPAIVVRETNPRPEVNVVATGPYGSLTYYLATPGSQWVAHPLLGRFASNYAISTPTLAVRANGEANVVVRTAENTLVYFYATPGSPWQNRFIDLPGGRIRASAFSAPALAVRNADPDKEADIVVRRDGQGNDACVDGIGYHFATPGSGWSADTLPYLPR